MSNKVISRHARPQNIYLPAFSLKKDVFHQNKKGNSKEDYKRQEARGVKGDPRVTDLPLMGRAAEPHGLSSATPPFPSGHFLYLRTECSGELAQILISTRLDHV